MHRLSCTLLLLAAVSGCGRGERAQPDVKPASPTEAADALFQEGQFAEAHKLYAEIAARDPQNYQAAFRVGEIALLGNRLDEAEKWLTKAVALKPDDKAAKISLAEVYTRRDEFAKAAPLLQATGQKAKGAQLGSFTGLTPYQLEGPGQETIVKVVATDPLPLVQVRVNGKEATFFLDTGASDVYLDSDFAKELGVEDYGAEEGTFAGGEKAAVRTGRIGSLGLSAWDVKNVPVYTIALRPLSKLLGAKQIDGCLGTVLFYHFLTTFDYSKGELVLRRRTAENLKQFDMAQGAGSVQVPFWMASDHFMVTFGTIDQLKPALLFVDTGTAGAGVKLGDRAIKEAGIKLLEDKAIEGVGGGGKVRSVPFVVSTMSLGKYEERNVPGLYEGPFPWAETFGFRLIGMVGHDFFKKGAITFDFDGMKLTLRKG